MRPSTSLQSFRSKAVIIPLVSLFVIVLFLVNLDLGAKELLSSKFGHYGESSTSSPADKNSTIPEKLGFITYLSSRTSDDEPDPYFDMVRVMAYKLLHNEDTKTQLADAPFIVLTTETVTEKKKQRLRDDGALVKEVKAIASDTTLEGGATRWWDTMTKFRIWQLTEYSRLLFMDCDIYMLRNLDRIFDDPSSHALPRIKNIPEHEDEGGSDDTYILAASDYVEGSWEHTIPVSPNSMFNSGFFVFKPSEKMYQRYLRISQISDRYDHKQMDQGLLNYAHDKSSATPWSRLEPGKWVANFPQYKDYEAGVATIHEKMWKIGDENLSNMYEKDISNLRKQLGV